jgi:hypothetical protein
MKIHRAIIHPQTPAELVIRLPDGFLHTPTEVIAFSLETVPEKPKRSYASAVAFYKRHAIDFSSVKKWRREDLYE